MLPGELSSPKFSGSHHLLEGSYSGRLKVYLLFVSRVIRGEIFWSGASRAGFSSKLVPLRGRDVFRCEAAS